MLAHAKTPVTLSPLKPRRIRSRTGTQKSYQAIDTLIMDFKRYSLIAAIAILSYLLLIEWSQFSAEKKQTQPTSVLQAANLAPAEIAETLDATAIPLQPASVENIPSAVETHELKTIASNSSTIAIETDSLIVNIDLLGGDISYAALPRHFAAIDTPDRPFVLLENNQQRTYIAQSGLIGKNGTDTNKGRPLFTSEQQEYRLDESADSLTVSLYHRTDNNVQIRKDFIFKRGSYVIDVNYVIDNQSPETWSAGMFGQLKRDNTIDPGAESSGMGMAPYLGAAFTLVDEPYKKVAFDEFQEKPFNNKREGGWCAIVQHYFLSAWIPNKEATNVFTTLKTANGDNLVRFTSTAISVEPGQQGSIEAQFYAGPKDQYSLQEISPGLELSVDYGFLWLPAQGLFWLLTKIHAFFGNWGVAIIGVTLLVKIAFFQLNAKAYTSMANMRKVQPKLLEIRERHADDKAKQSQAMMKLYKDEKINPLGGCLPILVQMPIFISLYWVLMESVELRHAPFMLWIDDLAAMDPYFILPLIMGASMFIQQKLNPPPPDPMQAKVMQWLPVMFTFFFLFFPSGLVLYWVVNNVLSIAQQYIITKRIENA